MPQATPTIWNPILQKIQARRPSWRLIGEDSILRILTSQFVVEWSFIEELKASGKYEVTEVVTHATLGVVITMKCIDGI